VLRFQSLKIICSFFVVVATFACTKIDTTKLGTELIPQVDNVSTFDTLLDVTTKNYLYTDSTRIGKNQLHAIGAISNDPLFGSITASTYTEMMPNVFPSAYKVDSLIAVDSIVLSLAFNGSYGDSTEALPINFRVLRVAEQMIADTPSDYPSIYKMDKTFATAGVLGTKSYTSIKQIRDSVTVKHDSTSYKVKNQIRIVLNKDADILKALTDTNALKTDTLFRSFFKGFKIEATVGGANGALVYVNLSDTATKLEYFTRVKNGAKIDTGSIVFDATRNNTAHLASVVRNLAGSEALANANSDSLLYIYTTPGSYARIKIPNLQNVSNRIVHRAELVITQIPDALSLSSKLLPPPYLYLDRFDTAVDKVKYNIIPFDLNPNESYSCFPQSGVDWAYFGGTAPEAKTINGVNAYVYKFNISRYVQQIITNHISNLDLRLSSQLFAEYFNCNGVTYTPVTNNRIGEGRIKLGGGAAKNSNFPYKMQLRIIYSKL
jgi:hypothetical protein